MLSSVVHLLLDTVQNHGSQIAVKHKKGGNWQELTWTQIGGQVDQVASALIALGVAPQDRVAILSQTRLEWVLADLAIFRAGAVTVPIYTATTQDGVADILNDSQASVVIVDGLEQLEKIHRVKARVPSLKTIIVLDETPVSEASADWTWSALIQSHETTPKVLAQRLLLLSSSELASIVYTSGTTGQPKGAMLTHGNLLYEAVAIDEVGLVNSRDTQLLFLPLAHIFARVLVLAWLKTAHVLAFAESIEKAVENMKDVGPTLAAAVPRIYEKIHQRVVSTALSQPGIKAKLAHWAFEQGKRAAQLEANQKKPSGIAWFLARKLVFKKINARLKELFGGHLQFFISGGAPLAPEVAYFFKYAGVTIFEGYGLTESTAASCLNIPRHQKIGTVGGPLPGTEIKVAEDGEVLIRGGGVFKGYWNKPQETQAVLGSDGWFKTGDIGVLDREGFLKLTDRKKDLIVTAGGKNVAPQKVENLMKAASALIAHVIVFGDKKPYLVALITLEDPSHSQNPKTQEAIAQAVKSANQKLARFEQIKRFHILNRELKVGEELTPTLKVKRNFCAERYKAELDALYLPN